MQLMFGLSDDARAHLRGLGKMIYMRGGVASSASQELLGVPVSLLM